MLLAALPVKLTADEVTAHVAKLGDGVVAAFQGVGLDGIQWDKHGLMLCEELGNQCYAHRRTLNATVDECAIALADSPPPDTAPAQSATECLAAEMEAEDAYRALEAQLAAAEVTIRRREKMRQEIAIDENGLPDMDEIKKVKTDAEAQRVKARNEGAEMQQALVEAREREQAALDAINSAAAMLGRRSSLDAKKADLADLEAQLKDTDPDAKVDLELALGKARGARAAREAQDSHNSAAQANVTAREQAKLSDKLVALFRDALPKHVLSRMDMPVDGLTVEDETIKINGVPLHQLGTSEQITVGVRVASALTPQCGFVLIDGAESLGRADRIALNEVARELDLQLILTIVDPDAVPAENVVVMAKGKVVA